MDLCAEKYNPFATTGIHFEYKTIRIGDATVKLQIWYSGTYASAITLLSAINSLVFCLIRIQWYRGPVRRKIQPFRNKNTGVLMIVR